MITKFELDDNKKLFLISDTHFCHKNIISYTNRPFDNVQLMTETIIDNWNNTVTDEDQIIFLGDFVMGVKDPKYVSAHLYDCLNGIKIFIAGNHDSEEKRSDHFAWLEGICETEYRDHKLCLNHYPHTKEELKEGYFHFHGHSHSTTKVHHISNDINNFKLYNVACEALNYTPILFEDMINEI